MLACLPSQRDLRQSSTGCCDALKWVRSSGFAQVGLSEQSRPGNKVRARVPHAKYTAIILLTGLQPSYRRTRWSTCGRRTRGSSSTGDQPRLIIREPDPYRQPTCTLGAWPFVRASRIADNYIFTARVKTFPPGDSPVRISCAYPPSVVQNTRSGPRGVQRNDAGARSRRCIYMHLHSGRKIHALLYMPRH